MNFNEQPNFISIYHSVKVVHKPTKSKPKDLGYCKFHSVDRIICECPTFMEKMVKLIRKQLNKYGVK